MSLRYPSDAFSGDADYVSFKPMKYTSRGSGGGGGGGYIMIAMPERLPTVTNANAWEQVTFGPGPIGQFLRDGFQSADEVLNVAFSKGIAKDALEQGSGMIAERFANLGNRLGPMGQQFLLEASAGIAGMNANQALSVTSGTIYNPNIELAYQGPQFRQFQFNFKMVPKSAGEASAISSIIREFKRWSAPALKSGGMYEIPYVWQISYMSGGGQNSFQNKFKPAACTGVAVTDNAGVGFYSAHQGGAAVETNLTVMFQEVDVITRKDHSGARGM